MKRLESTGGIPESGAVEKERSCPRGCIAVTGHCQIARIAAEESIVHAEVVKERDARLQNVTLRCRRISHREIARYVNVLASGDVFASSQPR